MASLYGSVLVGNHSLSVLGEEFHVVFKASLAEGDSEVCWAYEHGLFVGFV